MNRIRQRLGELADMAVTIAVHLAPALFSRHIDGRTERKHDETAAAEDDNEPDTQ